MKQRLLVFVALILMAVTLQAEHPKEMIRAFVEAQPKLVTAYDIAAHFNALTTDPVYGAENVFNAANTSWLSVAALDATHFVVAYRDDGNSGRGTAIVGQVSGTTITSYGTENVFNAASTFDISIAAMDATHFVVAYRDFGNSNHGTAIVGQVSGTTITSYGAENVFHADSTSDTSIAAMDATHFVVVYRDFGNGNLGMSIAGQVSGTTITSYGAESAFNVAGTEQISIAAMDATHFVVAYRDNGNSNHGTARVGQISGTTISGYGAENVFNATSTDHISIAVLDATHFVVAYRDFGDSSHGIAVVGQVSGTTISGYGAENVFNAVSTSDISIAAMDATSFVAVYYSGILNIFGGDCDSGSCTYQSIIGDVSGTTITYGNQIEVDNSIGASGSNLIAVANIGSFITVYADNVTLEGTGKAASAGVLPVELVRFQAQKKDAGILLHWQTASETNNQGFEVQRSTTFEDWEVIGFVEGDINAVTLNDYFFTDKHPISGNNYYRLKQIDLDGKFEYSDIVVVNNIVAQAIQTFVYPNPTEGNFTFSINNPDSQKMNIQLRDQLGRMIWNSGLIQDEPVWNKEFQLDQHGVYFISIQVGQQLIHERIMVMRKR